MLRPKRLVEYTWVVVRFNCVLCTRKRCYRLARLASRYGPEQSLEGLLADLAHDYPWWRTNSRKYEPRRGARFVDLERNLPPVDDPESPFRKRQPGREDIPQRRSITASAPAAVPMLSTYPHQVITIVCNRSGRREQHMVEELLLAGDVRLTDLLPRLTADCPHRGATSIYERCMIEYEMPEG